jgi:hypothetical protein
MTIVVLAAATVAAFLAGSDRTRPFQTGRAFIAGIAVFLVLSLVLTGSPFTILDEVTRP